MKRLILPIFVSLLAVISIHAQRPMLHKMSPMLRQQVASKAPAPSICAFVRISGDAEQTLLDNGCRQLARLGDISIASIPADRLSALSRERNVSRIEARRGMHILMDSMAIQLNALPAYAGTGLPQAYTGEGVVMGVMDIGFDLTHPNFYDATATHYRIKRLWDQISTDTIGSPLFVGRDYTTEEELLALGCSRDGTFQTHGTHTLGSAAGSGYNSPYRGMAPDADICLVANAVTEDIALIDSADYDKYTYATDALGFKYIFDYADSVGKPCVISFSEGSGQDFQGYDVLFYEMLHQLVGPGHILLASAGNSGHIPSYIHKQPGQHSAGIFIGSSTDRINITTKTTAPFLLRNIYYNAQSTDTLIIDPTWALAMPDSSIIDTTFVVGGKEYFYSITAYPSCYNADEMCYDIQLRTLGRPGYDKHISFEFVGDEADVEVYRVTGDMFISEKNPLLADAECSHTIHSPASAPDVICVGSTSYRTSIINYKGEKRIYDQGTNGQRGPFSSIGPTTDGRIKPDVMAPGVNVISSYSSYYLENNPTASDITWDVEHFDFNGRTYAWNSNSGTSMSTPAAAGAVALWLQAKPTLTPEEVLDVIAHTSYQYDKTLTYPNNLYGYGQIDTYRGLLYILGIDGVEGLSTRQPQHVGFSLDRRGHVTLTFDTPIAHPFNVRVYATSGAQVLQQHFGKGMSTYDLDLTQLPDGIYAIQLNTGHPTTTGSTLIRLSK